MTNDERPSFVIRHFLRGVAQPVRLRPGGCNLTGCATACPHWGMRTPQLWCGRCRGEATGIGFVESLQICLPVASPLHRSGSPPGGAGVRQPGEETTCFPQRTSRLPDPYTISVFNCQKRRLIRLTNHLPRVIFRLIKIFYLQQTIIHYCLIVIANNG